MTAVAAIAVLTAVAGTTVAVAAVSQKTIQTARLGAIRCWVGDAAANRIIDSQVNCLQGRGGSDYLSGMAGNDRIDGEFGDVSRDEMYGGAGTDIFYVDTGFAAGDARIDRINDMAAGETLCSRAAFTSWRRTVTGTSGAHRFIVVPDLIGGEVVIAWIRDLGTKRITVRGACYLMNE